MPIEIIREDITKLECDAIVNPSNVELTPTSGFEPDIHKAAGKRLLKDCKNIGKISVGSAVITPAYKLKAKFVIHTACPVWNGGSYNEEALLKACYINALELALHNSCQSIAFPMIPAGTYGHQNDKILKLAINTINKFLFDNELMVYLVVFDKTAFELNDRLFTKIQSFIDDNYAITHSYNNSTEKHGSRRLFGSSKDFTKIAHTPKCNSALRKAPADSLDKCCDCDLLISDTDDYIKNIDDYIKLDEGFALKLMKLIDAKGMKDVECYKKANVSKQTWYKIMNDKHYKPNKKTVISFSIALRLTLEETQNLLESVGFILSNSSLFDVIIMFCLQNGIYDVLEIDSILFKYDQETLYTKL
ncbi:MAG: macro domain-containing protein [Acutalibacteraceae bacterium]|nr:macro domain-containing protein [Acutalibacteraceae bacterium]